MKIEAACIDLDGTLLDTIPDLAAAANRMLTALDMPPLPEERIREFVGKGAEVLIQRTLVAAGVASVAGDADHEQARVHFYDSYRRLNGTHATVYSGVIEGLEGLRALGLRLACVTNKPAEFIAPLLQRFRLADYFEFAIGGDTLAFKKPHPGQLLEACRRWALAPPQVLAVGDSLNDAQAARAAGMPVFLVPYGYNEGCSVHGADVDGIVSSLSELPSLIQGQNARVS
ncbi:MAG: phosphoglycolate phosphatase [Lautropia sp.]|nr:phosphoglycolate phosphatase [Lautropia sp.]